MGQVILIINHKSMVQDDRKWKQTLVIHEYNVAISEKILFLFAALGTCLRKSFMKMFKLIYI